MYSQNERGIETASLECCIEFVVMLSDANPRCSNPVHTVITGLLNLLFLGDWQISMLCPSGLSQ